jgi:hypothetical protein
VHRHDEDNTDDDAADDNRGNKLNLLLALKGSIACQGLLAVGANTSSMAYRLSAKRTNWIEYGMWYFGWHLVWGLRSNENKMSDRYREQVPFEVKII